MPHHCPDWPFAAPPPRSLAASPFFAPLTDAVTAALAAVHPGAAVRQALGLEGGALVVGDRRIELTEHRRVRVVGGGKGAEPMAAAIFDILGERIDQGCVAVKQGERTGAATGPIRIIEAGHPMPDAASQRAAREICRLAAGLGPADLALALVSGGASALLAGPAPPLTLAHLRDTTWLLLEAGVEIEGVNTVRKHLSTIKGGRLMQQLAPAAAVTLILSDVVGDPLHAIGSGPTAPDPTTFHDACAIVERARLRDRLPPLVWAHLAAGRRGDIEETPKPGDPIFSRASAHLLGSGAMAAAAARDALRGHGIDARCAAAPLVGEAREAAARVVAAVPDRAARRRPAAVVYSGETTVTVTGAGKGGRNQELALAAAIALQSHPDTLLLTVATDGGDGPTDAAGAAVTHQTVARAASAGVDAAQHLRDNNAHPFFAAIGDLLVTGPTQTNVADLTLVLSW